MISSRGYTLVEILVVLVIITTLSGLIILRVGQFGSATPAQQLDQFATLLSNWCEQGVFQQRNLAVRISAEGYDFWEPLLATENAVDRTGDAGSNWRANQLEPFVSTTWEGAVQPDLLVAGQPTALDLEVPQLRCFAASQMTPFTLRLSQAGSQRQSRGQSASLQADSSGRLRLLD